MIQTATVRRAPKTGLGRSKRYHTGLVYFTNDWLGDRVVTMSFKEYRQLIKLSKAYDLKLKIKQMEKQLDRIRRISS